MGKTAVTVVAYSPDGKKKKIVQNGRSVTEVLVFYSQGKVLLGVTTVPQQPRPQLHTDDAENEENKKAEQQHIAQHGQSIQQQIHQDPHTCGFQETFQSELLVNQQQTPKITFIVKGTVKDSCCQTLK